MVKYLSLVRLDDENMGGGVILLLSLHLCTFEIAHNKTNPQWSSRDLRIKLKIPKLVFKASQDLSLPHFSSSLLTLTLANSLGTQLSPAALFAHESPSYRTHFPFLPP